MVVVVSLFVCLFVCLSGLYNSIREIESRMQKMLYISLLRMLKFSVISKFYTD